MADIISLEITCGKGVKQITADGITTSFLSTTQTITSSKTFDCKVGADLTLTATAKSGYSASDVVWRVLGLDEDKGKTFHYTTDSGRYGIITIEALILSSSGGDEGGDEGDDWTIQNKLSQGLENFEKFQQSYNFESYNIYVFSVYNNSNQDATVFLNARSTDNTTTLLGYLNDSWRFNEQIGKPDIYDTSDSGTEISFQKMLSADDTESLLFWVRCEDDADTADVTVTITSTLTGWRKITQVYVYNNSQWKEVTSYVMEGANDNRKILTPYVYVGKSVT